MYFFCQMKFGSLIVYFGNFHIDEEKRKISSTTIFDVLHIKMKTWFLFLYGKVKIVLQWALILFELDFVKTKCLWYLILIRYYNINTNHFRQKRKYTLVKQKDLIVKYLLVLCTRFCPMIIFRSAKIGTHCTGYFYYIHKYNYMLTL